MAVVDYGTGTRDVDIEGLTKQLRDKAAAEGTQYDDSDLQGVLRNISYDTGGKSLEDALQNQFDIYGVRGHNVPGDEDGDGIPDNRTGGGGSGGSGGGSGGGPTPTSNNNGGADTHQQMDELLGLMKGMNAGSDVTLPEYDLPTAEDLAITVPGQDLGPAIDSTLQDVMGGRGGELTSTIQGQLADLLKSGPEDPLGMQDRLKALLDRTAGGGINSKRLLNRQEAARENLTRGEMAAGADLRGVLADRGTIGLPGAPSGIEAGETSRLFDPLQRNYLAELRQAMTDESTSADKAEQDALTQGQTFTSNFQATKLDTISKAMGWDGAQVQQRLAAAQTAQEREQVMAEISLSVLDKNIEWNKFLADFGLQREQVAAQIQQGRTDAIMPVLQMFLGLLGQSRGGYI